MFYTGNVWIDFIAYMSPLVIPGVAVLLMQYFNR